MYNTYLLIFFRVKTWTNFLNKKAKNVKLNITVCFIAWFLAHFHHRNFLGLNNLRIAAHQKPSVVKESMLNAGASLSNWESAFRSPRLKELAIIIITIIMIIKFGPTSKQQQEQPWSRIFPRHTSEKWYTPFSHHRSRALLLYVYV